MRLTVHEGPFERVRVPGEPHLLLSHGRPSKIAA
jgi:hypothetical protein